MTRKLFTLLTVLAAVAVLTVPAMAQAPAGPMAGPWGAQVPLTTEQIAQLRKAQELRSKIAVAQLDLLSLQQQNADQKKIDAKAEEIAKLRTQLYELNATNRPAVAPGFGGGMGRGPCAWGGGPGMGMGRGPCGWGAGPGVGQQWQQGWGGGRGRGGGFGGRWGRGGGGGWGGPGPAYGPFCPYRPF